MVQDVGISESEGETTATKASKRRDPSGNASVSAGVVGYRRGDASQTLSGCSSFFPSIGTRPGNPGIFLNKFTQKLKNWGKFLQLYAFLSHMYLCLRSLKFVAAQELQRVLERGPEGQQDKTGTEVIHADVIQCFTACTSRKHHASQCTTVDDII